MDYEKLLNFNARFHRGFLITKLLSLSVYKQYNESLIQGNRCDRIPGYGSPFVWLRLTVDGEYSNEISWPMG